MNSLSSFLHQLRQAGFDISPAISIEIAQILPDVESMQQLRLSLRMLICTTKQQQDLFDFIWQVESSEFDKFEEDKQQRNQDRGSDDMSDDLPLELPDSITDAEYCPNPGSIASGSVSSNDPSVALIRFASDLKGSAKQMIQGNYRNAAAILLRYLLTASSDISQFGMQRDMALDEIEEMIDYVAPKHSEDLLRRLNRQLDELLKENLSAEDIMGGEKMTVQHLEDLPLISLQHGKEVQQALRQLGKKLASKYKRKQKQGNRKINLRRTIRANIQHGGTLLELKQYNPRKDKPKLVILTDVSSSTIKATRMFLTIIWHAKHIFSDIRFFEFIASVIDVTSEWKRADSVDEAVDQALDRWDRQQFGTQNSDYHQAFTMFDRQWGDTISSKDTIIVLGDLRDWLGPRVDDTPVSATVMANIANFAKRMIVLNPEPEKSWNTGDSIVGYVKAHDIEVYEANTLNKLIDVLLDLS